jgi:hypothetical protein
MHLSKDFAFDSRIDNGSAEMIQSVIDSATRPDNELMLHRSEMMFFQKSRSWHWSTTRKDKENWNGEPRTFLSSVNERYLSND